MTLLLYIYCFCFVFGATWQCITLSCIKCKSSTLIREIRQTARLHGTLLHSGSTQLNYEWRSILREGNCQADSLRSVPTREELRGFREKIKRKKSLWRQRVLLTRTIQKLQYVGSIRYLTDLPFGMQFSYVTSFPSTFSTPKTELD